MAAPGWPIAIAYVIGFFVMIGTVAAYCTGSSVIAPPRGLPAGIWTEAVLDGYLREHPGDYATVQQPLGHTSVQTTTRFYVALESTHASEVFGKIIRSRIIREHEDEDPRNSAG